MLYVESPESEEENEIPEISEESDDVHFFFKSYFIKYKKLQQNMFRTMPSFEWKAQHKFWQTKKRNNNKPKSDKQIALLNFENTLKITGEWVVTDLKNNINYIYYWDWDQLGVGKKESRLGYEFKCITKNKGKNRFVWREFAIEDDSSEHRLRIMKCKLISENEFIGKMKLQKLEKFVSLRELK